MSRVGGAGLRLIDGLTIFVRSVSNNVAGMGNAAARTTMTRSSRQSLT